MRLSLLFCSVAVALSACADPLRDVPRLSDVELTPDDPVVQALPSEAEVARQGFFGQALPDAGDNSLSATPDKGETPTLGLKALFQRMTPQVSASDEQKEVAGSQQNDVVAPQKVARLKPEDENNPLQEPKPSVGGFWSGLSSGSASPSDDDSLDVTFGTVLPYGEVGRVCDARGKPLGRKVENASASRYKLFDSTPNATGQRTYYITGFSDGCPRQLTAAHVLLGAPSFYELLHYGPAGAHLPVGETDRAYEKVKAQVCGARKGKPCGSKMQSLERTTFFVNAYERMKDNTRWSELLVHQGRVVASTMKSN